MLKMLKWLLNMFSPETARIPTHHLKQIVSLEGEEVVAYLQNLEQTGQASTRQVFQQLVKEGYMKPLDVASLRDLYNYYKAPPSQRSWLGPPLYISPAALKKAAKLSWLRKGLGAECPKCVQMTARTSGQGRWQCSNGCDLTGYHQCPRCGDLYQGTAPFCADNCKDFRG